jgi:hypothetical protein
MATNNELLINFNIFVINKASLFISMYLTNVTLFKGYTKKNTYVSIYVHPINVYFLKCQT